MFSIDKVGEEEKEGFYLFQKSGCIAIRHFEDDCHLSNEFAREQFKKGKLNSSPSLRGSGKPSTLLVGCEISRERALAGMSKVYASLKSWELDDEYLALAPILSMCKIIKESSDNDKFNIYFWPEVPHGMGGMW